MTRSVTRRSAVVLMVLALLGATMVSAAPSAGAAVRGFDGSTITVAGLGIKKLLPSGEQGAAIKRFNDTNEIKGIKIDYAELADDNQDPATALSEARRLVSQVGVFAIVGDISANNPVQYFAQQHVPYFGGGFDTTYCSNKPSTSLWGFSSGGCTVPADPSFVTDVYTGLYKYVSTKLNKKNPTMVLFGSDNESGKNGAKVFSVAAQGAGFKVVDVQNRMPPPPVNDYSPYTQAVMEGDNGQPPDATFCIGSTDCLNVWELMKAQGFEGVFSHGFYHDLFTKQAGGTVVNGPYVPPIEDTPGLQQLRADFEAFEPGLGSKVDLGNIYGYTSTDMFIQALKTVAKKGKRNITPENVREAASTMKWQIKGLMGPKQYPKSTVMGFPACFMIVSSDGTTWSVEEPYTCSTKTFKPNLKIG